MTRFNARAAQDLGVKLVVIGSAVSPAVTALCEKLDMTCRQDRFYDLAPDRLLANCQSRGSLRDWTV